MFIYKTIPKSLVTVILFAPIHAAGSVNTFGATGLYNIPNADTSHFGDFYLGFNNNIDTAYKKTPTTSGLNYVANLGVYPNLEINLRLLEVLDRNIHQANIYRDFYKRDLSGNLKFKLPYISNRRVRFAIGATDVGGLAVNFRRFYSVASYEFKNFDITAGYSFKENTKDQVVNLSKGFKENNILDGFFYGMEYKPFNWLGILAENESSGSRVGGRVIWNNPGGWSGALTAGYVFFDTGAENGFSVGLSVPIGGSSPGSDLIENNNPSKQTDWLDKQNQDRQKSSLESSTLKGFSINASSNTSVEDDIQDSISEASTSQNLQAQSLQYELEKAGLDSIQIGFNGSTLVVTYQNRVFNWNQIHAISAALKTIADSKLLESFNNVELITVHNNIPVLKTNVSQSRLIQLVKETTRTDYGRIGAWLQFKNTSKLPTATWLIEPKTNSKVDISFTLAYKAYYGTEWANWDYSIALRPIIEVPLWTGAHLSNVYHLGPQNSYGFEHGVFKEAALTNQMNELMIHQTVQPFTGFANTLSYGELKLGQEPLRGFMNQGEYQLFDGYSRLYWRQGQMSSMNNKTLDLDYNAIGAELNWPQANLVAGYQKGKYIEGDISSIVYGRIKLGNATVNIGLTTSDIKWKRIDMSLAFPIGPEKNITLGPVTLGGDSSWSTGMGTVIDNPISSGANLINTNPSYKLVGAALVNSYSQTESMYDNGRLTPAYLKTHIKQLLDGFEVQ